MPLIKLQMTISLNEDKRKALLASLSKILTESIGKPEQYVMATIEPEVTMMMAGKYGDAAFAEVKSIGGLTAKVNTQIARKLCALLEESLGISPNRIYLNFTNISASDWGWNGDTFG
jgi:phenylpyruvate tautomerase PptA (4-oxalocrotonate tautomerase family)